MRVRQQRPLVLVCDANYQPAACVVLTSVFLNSPSAEFTTIIVTDAPNPRLTAAVARLADTFGRDIKIAAFDTGAMMTFGRQFAPIAKHSHITAMTMARLALPALLPAESFVYLDCDLVVQDDIARLLTLDLGQNLVAAADDGPNTAGNGRRFGFSPHETYVNAGVLVVNARAWREAGGTDALVAARRKFEGRLPFADQDVVNLFCRGRSLILEPRWNTLLYSEIVARKWAMFDPETFRGIFHFAGGVKPWMAWAPPAGRRLYGRYAAVAPWRMAEPRTPRNDGEVQEMKLLWSLTQRYAALGDAKGG